MRQRVAWSAQRPAHAHRTPINGTGRGVRLTCCAMSSRGRHGSIVTARSIDIRRAAGVVWHDDWLAQRLASEARLLMESVPIGGRGRGRALGERKRRSSPREVLLPAMLSNGTCAATYYLGKLQPVKIDPCAWMHPGYIGDRNTRSPDHTHARTHHPPIEPYTIDPLEWGQVTVQSDTSGHPT